MAPVRGLTGHTPDKDIDDAVRATCEATPVLLPTPPAVRAPLIGERIEGAGTGPTREVRAAAKTATRASPATTVPHDLRRLLGRPFRPPLNAIHRPAIVPATETPRAPGATAPLPIGAGEVVTRNVRPPMALATLRVPPARIPRPKVRRARLPAAAAARPTFDPPAPKTVYPFAGLA